MLEKKASRPEEALYRINYFPPTFWDDFEPASLLHAVERSIEYLDRLKPDYLFHYGPDTFTCKEMRASHIALLELIKNSPNSKELNKGIKKKFFIYKAAGRPGNNKVLFTGYFEPLYQGSLEKDETYKYPLYKKPGDLIKIDLSLFRNEFKGKSLTARINGNKIVPYHSRKQIETEKALEGNSLEIAWLKDPVDVAFLHIQGSGRLMLPDGKTISVGYHAANGRPYMSIGRYLIDKGFLTREEMSMQRIRQYLSSNPGIVEEVLNHNPSYVFFRVLENGPYGNINVALTPGRSIALDRRIFPKGAFCFIKAQKPTINERGEIIGWTDFSRFVLNQDTGGAIRGAGRADLFWGSGQYAELAAGHMKHEGELYFLIKKPE